MKAQRITIMAMVCFAAVFSFASAVQAATDLDKQLIEAVKKEDLQSAKACLSQGADPNALDEEGHTNVHLNK